MDRDYFGAAGEDDEGGGRNIRGAFAGKQRDIGIQFTISIVFGLIAFVAFCLLRPRWTSLYAARKKRKSEAAPLPQLPKTLFTWIPAVYKISDEEVLASAGLDAYAFLAFFRMALKYLAFLFVFALTVIFPVINHYERQKGGKSDGDDQKGNDTDADSVYHGLRARSFSILEGNRNGNDSLFPLPDWWDKPNDYLWIYLFFVYLFTAVGVYLIVTETQKMISLRQRYLAVQSSIADRTIRLSGIPEELREETKLKETIESLEIGKVESITICRNWTELDDLMDERTALLQSLEGVWTQYLGSRGTNKKTKSRLRGTHNGTDGDEEQATLLGGSDPEENSHIMAYDRPRPTKRLWYGVLNLQNRKVDAIDYYEEKLRRLDERIKTARKKEYPAVPLAFVTLDSTAACQMACQAIIDPQPMQLMANPSPSPSGVMWRNTYLPRKTRMFRSWTITAFIFVLTIFWSFLLLPLAAIRTLDNISAVSPGLADWLEEHKNIQSIVRTGVPTLIIAILNVVVPYFYEYLSYMQGMTSIGDIETSLISKNFFFTFFNLFVVFTIFGTGTAAPWGQFDEHLRDLPQIAVSLALGLKDMSSFYLNYIILQTFGLFPFRLLQFGSIALYPWYRLRAKTPRDHSQLMQPGTFTYGFFMPQTLFIFIICIAYSVSENTELIQAVGLVYFGLGAFIYKYQLLYAMDHRQFSTGRAWPMMCTRFAAGLVVFQLVMAGQLAVHQAFVRGGLVAPLIVATVWFTVWYRRTYEPLMKNLALRTLREVQDEAAEARMSESILSGDLGSASAAFSGSDDTLTPATASAAGDMNRFRWPDLGVGAAAGGLNGNGNGNGNGTANGTGVGSEQPRSRFVNPSLVRPLESPWIARTAEREAELNSSSATRPAEGVAAAERRGEEEEESYDF